MEVIIAKNVKASWFLLIVSLFDAEFVSSVLRLSGCLHRRLTCGVQAADGGVQSGAAVLTQQPIVVRVGGQVGRAALCRRLGVSITGSGLFPAWPAGGRGAGSDMLALAV